MNVSNKGVTLRADVTGSGDLALVFMHYWGGTARSWSPVISALPPGTRRIALDARGWGGSDRPAEGYDIATMADDAIAAIAAIGLKHFVLVGHSMGGKVAQLLASRQPTGLAGLILVAPSPARGKSIAAPERNAMKGAYASPESVAWTIDNVLTERVLPQSLRDMVVADSLAGGSDAKEYWPAAAISEDVSSHLARIDVPVLIIGGEKDKVDSVEMLKSVVLPSLPGASMKIVPGVGHLLPLEAPQEVAELISEFIETVLSAPRPRDGEFPDDGQDILPGFHRQSGSQRRKS